MYDAVAAVTGLSASLMDTSFHAEGAKKMMLRISISGATLDHIHIKIEDRERMVSVSPT